VETKSFRYVEELYKLSNIQAEKYAEYCGADYKLITDTNYLPNKHPVYQRLKVFDWANDYDQILYLDSDAVPLNNIPNIFEITKNSEFSATWDRNWNSAAPFYQDLLRLYRKKFKCSDDYKPFNSGVMVISNSWLHKVNDIWRKYLNTFDKGAQQDQGLLNKVIIDLGEKYNVLDPDWGAGYKSGKYIIHLAANRKKNFNTTEFCKKHKLYLP
jgi:lipopolysaccharide biosynthesis glycosyltransferase